MPYENRVAIVTGGASGIGRALGQALARRGATVVIADIDLAGAQDVVAGITTSGGSATAALVDVRRAGDVQALVTATASRHGRLDFLFNNAGVGVGGEMHELTLEQWRAAIDINLMGVIHGVAAAYPVMLRQGSGHIVNIASLSALVPSPGLGPYAATKGAVVSLTLALRAEGEAFGVRATVVCPGFVDTAIFENAIGLKLDKADLLEKLGLPLLPADDAARAILGGVERNHGLIVFPRSARILWRVTRFTPFLSTALMRRMIRRLRAVRRSDAHETASPEQPGV